MWTMENFFQVDNGMGPEAPAAQIWLLRFHGIFSYAVVMLLGYVLRAHVLPHFRVRQGLKSGLPLGAHFLLILMTVPFLLYLTDEKLKVIFEQTHAYLGLLLLLTFGVHLGAKIYRKK